MSSAAKEYGWTLNLGQISMLWRGGCIIQARFLNRIKEAFARNTVLVNLLLDPYFKNIVEEAQANWQKQQLTVNVQPGVRLDDEDIYDAIKRANFTPGKCLQ